MNPPTWLGQTCRIVRHMPALEPAANQPVESINQCSEWTEVTAESARNQNAKSDNRDHPDQCRVVQRKAGESRRQSDQWVDEQKRLDGRPFLCADRVVVKSLRKWPAHTKESIEKNDQA